MGDTAQQTLLKVGPDGRASYDFEGHISAVGLDLLAADLEFPPEDRKVRWLRESDGSVVAEINSRSWSRGDDCNLIARDPDDPADRYAELGLQATPLLAVDPTTPRSSVAVSAKYDADFGAATIVNSRGESTFLRQSAIQKTTVAFGHADNVPTPAFGVGGAADVAFAHGLSYTPTYAFVTIRPGGGLYYGFSVTGTFAVSPTQITATLHNHAGAVGASTINLQWLAVKIG